MTTDITELAQREKFEAWVMTQICISKSTLEGLRTTDGYRNSTLSGTDYNRLWSLYQSATAELVEALEKAQQRITQLESRTLKLPDGWQFEECEIEGCENGAIFSVGTGSRNIHLCDKCAHEPENSRLKKSPLSKRLPFKMSAGIKVEAE
ncbi:hypothetical protein [Klebsiella variicola]|uniref:hypothetical protein n=1 Tax=Klebsiella variicola TaxID=244366 RepID=UPI000B3E83D8|nr:hypothetical protein [Klebsiella variicola]AXO68684.1 hypothetical protein BC497_00425 [Klebsiella variicola]OUY98858.1 hypothetical protein BLL04_11970 [Klebsiella variicola]